MSAAPWPSCPFEAIVYDASAGNNKVQKADYLPSGFYPVVDQGQDLIGGYSNDEADLVSGAGPWVVFGDHTRAVKFLDVPFCMGADGVKVLVPKDTKKLDARFLYWFLVANPVPSAGYSRHYKFLKRMNVPLPSLDEQRRIAAILDQADALRQKRKRAIELLDSLTQSIFLEMFGDPIRQGATVRIADIALAVRIGPFGSALHQEDYSPDGIPLVNPMHIVDGVIRPSSSAAVKLSKYAELSQYRLQEHDVVLGRRGEMGRCAVVSEAEGGYLCGTGSMFIRPNLTLALPSFIQALLSSAAGVKFLEKASAGVTMANLNKGIVENIPLELPSIERQRAFSQAIGRVKALLQHAQISSSESNFTFSSIQHRAFTGQL